METVAHTGRPSWGTEMHRFSGFFLTCFQRSPKRLFGSFLSIACLFREHQSAQRKPAVKKTLRPLALLQLSKSWMSHNSTSEMGILRKPRASPKQVQTILATIHPKKTCRTVSKSPQRQHFVGPFHPRLAKTAVTCSLEWYNSQRKFLIFNGSLFFQIF